MSILEARKLKRGLKDLSPLFSTEILPHKLKLKPKVEAPDCFVEILNVFSPDAPGDSLFLNTFLASQIASPGRPCSILSLQSEDMSSPHIAASGCEGEPWQAEGEYYGENLKRFSLSWDHFERVCRCPIPLRSLDRRLSQMIFLDFESLSIPQMERVVMILDQWIFLLRPSLESLTEAYKLMKAAAKANPRLSYFVLFEGYPEDQKGSYLFEKLQAFAAKHLGINLFWLGYLNLARSPHYIATELVLDHLFLNPIQRINSPEKIALADFVCSSQRLKSSLP